MRKNKTKEKIKTIQQNLKKNLPALSKRVISINISKGKLEAVVVKKKGDRINIVSAHEVDIKSNTYDINRINQAFSSIVTKYIPKHAVCVTDQVKFLAAEINLPSGIKKISEDKLEAAAKWEMGPYINFPLENGFFSYRFLGDKKGTIPVLISAVNKDIFYDFFDVYKDSNLSLYSVYSPEIALAYSSEWENRILINYEKNTISGVLLRAESPPVFHTLSVEEEISQEDALKNLIEMFTTSFENIGEIVIAGSLASEEIVEKLKKEFLINVRLWDLKEDFSKLELSSETNIMPKYALAIGAALQELRIFGPPSGVTDRVSMLKQLKRNLYFLPVFLFVLIMFGFMGHYNYTKRNVSYYSSEISKLEKEKSRLLEFKQRRTRLISKRDNLKSQIVGLENKKKYIKSLPAYKNSVILFFKNISKTIPNSAILKKIEQKDDIFYLKGYSINSGKISEFVQDLLSSELYKEVRLVDFVKNIQDKNNVFPFQFTISVALRR